MVKKKEDVPEWVSNEIQSVKFEKPVSVTKLGYDLEIYEEMKKSMPNFTNQWGMEDLLLQSIYQKKLNLLIQWNQYQVILNFLI